MSRARPSWLPSGRALAAVAALGLALALGYLAVSSFGSWVVFEAESGFGRVRVVESAGGLRSLYTGPGRARQSAVIPGRPRHLELAYSRVATVGLALAPPEEPRILFVGLGGGAMPMYARQVVPRARVDVVEIDPVIVEVAQRFFGFRPDPRMVVHTGDGRAFIERAPPGSYDLIVLDAFSDDEIPFSLTTREFLEAVRSRLAPGGVVLSNLWSAHPLYRSMLATYGAVFDQVHLIRVPGRAQRILVAAPGGRALDRGALVEASRALARRAELGFDLPDLVERGYERPSARGAPVLEDRVEGDAAQGPRAPPPDLREPHPAVGCRSRQVLLPCRPSHWATEVAATEAPSRPSPTPLPPPKPAMLEPAQAGFVQS